jgi:hypothetical protein
VREGIEQVSPNGNARDILAWGEIPVQISFMTIIILLILNCIIHHPVALCRSDLAFRFYCRLRATSVNILSSFSLCCHYMFGPNRPSSGIQAVVMKESAVHCNAVLLFLCSFLGLFLAYVG